MRNLGWRIGAGVGLASMVMLAGCPAPIPSPKMTLGGTAPDGGGFIAFTDGQDQTLVYGAQGGFHLWMKFRLRDVPPHKSVAIQRMAWRDGDNQLVLRTMGSIDIGAPGPDGYYELPMAVPMFMCPSPIGLQVNDQLIRYQITLLDGTAPLAVGSIRLVPRCPQNAPPADGGVQDGGTDDHGFCVKICSG